MDEALKSVEELYLISPRQRRQATTKRVHAKVEEIGERLRALALELGAGTKLPTTRELCTSLQTSITTLTAALDLLETEHVLVRKERQGIFVADTINQKVIHVVYNVFSDDNRSPFWSLLWSRLVQETEQRTRIRNEQYRFHFVYRPFGQPLPENYQALLNSLQMDCCLLVGVNALTDDGVPLLHMPHVSFAGSASYIVGFELEKTLLTVAEEFVRYGCQKVGFLGRLYTHAGSMPLEEYDYTRFFKKALTHYGLPIYPHFFRALTVAFNYQLNLQEQGYLLAKEMFSFPPEDRPDGIHISDDMLTSGALVAWEEMGLKVGQDIKVISHANTGSPILFGRTQHMTLMEIDPEDIIRALFENLDRAMQADIPGEPNLTLVPSHLRLPL